MPDPTVLVAGDEAQRLVDRLAGAFLTRNPDPARAAIVGIHTHGVTLARRIQAVLQARTGVQLPLGVLDITLYRDDLDSAGPRPLVRSTRIDFNVQGRILLLVDDVLFTGRTVRAAIDEIIDFGRPAAIQLAVLVDRGHRELPIQPDFVGRIVETSRSDRVKVLLREDDGRDEVLLYRET